MINSPSEFFRETSDMAIRFLAGTDHHNVAKLFQKTGFTCELETEKGSFFESLILDEEDLLVRLKIYWGISVNAEYRSEIEAFIKNINGFLSEICSVSIEDSGRILSIAELSYEERALSCADFEKAEKACYVAINLFSNAAAKINCCGEIDADDFSAIIDSFYQTGEQSNE